MNALKLFISQGGRVLYIGENNGFQYTLTAANLLVAQMGGSTTSTGACAFGLVTTVSHPLTTGVAASGSGSVNIACASIMNTGTGDVVLMTYGGSAVVVIVKVTTTPLPTLRAEATVRAPSAVVQLAPVPGIDRTLGPTGKPPER